MIFRERDDTVPPSVARAAYEQQKRNRHAVTEFVQLAGPGHSAAIDNGWRKVAQTALTFVARFL